MFQLADGRQHVYQWDINVKLLLDESNESADEVHFSARFSRISLSVEVVHTEDSSYVTIPNILLQKPNDIIAYSYITNADGSYTKYDTIIPVIARPKPSGYVYEETEILTWESLDDKINDLGESAANSVKYTEQELTDEQKSRARKNIGATKLTDFENDLFYNKQTILLKLTKDDFEEADNNKPVYQGTPKLHWVNDRDITIEYNLTFNDGITESLNSNDMDFYRDDMAPDTQEWYSDHLGIINGFSYSRDDVFNGFEIWFSKQFFTEIQTVEVTLYQNVSKKIQEDCLELSGIRSDFDSQLSDQYDTLSTYATDAANNAKIPIVTTTGNGSAYKVTVPNFSVTKGALLVIIPHVASTDYQPTLSVNNGAAKKIFVPVSGLSGSNLLPPKPSWMTANYPLLLQYRSSEWIAISCGRARDDNSIVYGTCKSDSSATTKDVTVNSEWNYIGGFSLIGIEFVNDSTTSTTKLRIKSYNETVTLPVYKKNGELAPSGSIRGGSTYLFMYYYGKKLIIINPDEPT